jgi:hypothetical protein
VKTMLHAAPGVIRTRVERLLRLANQQLMRLAGDVSAKS